jgi:hypothetical protein
VINQWMTHTRTGNWIASAPKEDARDFDVRRLARGVAILTVSVLNLRLPSVVQVPLEILLSQARDVVGMNRHVFESR